MTIPLLQSSPTVLRSFGGLSAKVDALAPVAGALPIGALRSYGDACLSPTARPRLSPPVASLGEDGMTLEASSTATIADLVLAAQERGRFPAVVPGTAAVTVGGAISADVHGKNQEWAGSFGHHVARIDLDRSGWPLASLRARAENPVLPDHDLFRGLVGGMGLFGPIDRAAVMTVPAPTPLVVQATSAHHDLDGLFEAFGAASEPYSVAWIALSARSAMLPSRLMRGRHAEIAELPLGRRQETAAGWRRRALPVPTMPVRLMDARLMRWHDEWRLVRQPSRCDLVDIWSYFFPLDGLKDWNRLYGPAGFRQVQFVIDDDSDGRRLVAEALELARGAATLAVLKRLGQRGVGLLSFCRPGWTLALDIPAAADDVARRITAMAVEAGGAIYLAKDSLLSPLEARRAYPELAAVEAMRRDLGLAGAFRSNLMRRIGVL